jgi:hypothetical protein
MAQICAQAPSSHDANQVDTFHLQHNKNGGVEAHYRRFGRRSVEQPVLMLFVVNQEAEQSFDYAVDLKLIAEELENAC